MRDRSRRRGSVAPLIQRLTGLADTPSRRAAALRPRWLFEATVHIGCDRAAYYDQNDSSTGYGSSGGGDGAA